MSISKSRLQKLAGLLKESTFESHWGSRETMEAYYSDMYKEVNGIRPRESLDHLSDEELSARLDDLQNSINAAIEKDNAEYGWRRDQDEEEYYGRDYEEEEYYYAQKEREKERERQMLRHLRSIGIKPDPNMSAVEMMDLLPSGEEAEQEKEPVGLVGFKKSSKLGR